jgi:hypothetical protein
MTGTWIKSPFLFVLSASVQFALIVHIGHNVPEKRIPLLRGCNMDAAGAAGGLELLRQAGLLHDGVGGVA